MTAIARRAATAPRPAGRVFEHRFLSYRRTFRASLFSSFLTPGAVPDGDGPRARLLRRRRRTRPRSAASPTCSSSLPGLLAATAMQSAAFEATFPIMSGLLWSRVFHAMYATPIGSRDIALGNLAWIAFRLLLIATVFTIVIVAVRRGRRRRRSCWRSRPAVLTGLAFAAPIAAFAATQTTPDQVQRDLPVRDHAAVPVLGHVLPDRAACPSRSRSSPG